MEKQLEGLESLSINVEELYKEESITDRKAASIRRLIQINKDGSEDPTRETIYIGDTTLMTQMGPIPVQFPLEASNLEAAFELFPEGLNVLCLIKSYNVQLTLPVQKVCASHHQRHHLKALPKAQCLFLLSELLLNNLIVEKA